MTIKKTKVLEKLALIVFTILMFRSGYFLLQYTWESIGTNSQNQITTIIPLKALIPIMICSYVWVGISFCFLFAIFMKEEKAMNPAMGSAVGICVFLIVYFIGWISGFPLVGTTAISFLIGWLVFVLASIAAFLGLRNSKTKT
jgi:hypothetical protein